MHLFDIFSVVVVVQLLYNERKRPIRIVQIQHGSFVGQQPYRHSSDVDGSEIIAVLILQGTTKFNVHLSYIQSRFGGGDDAKNVLGMRSKRGLIRILQLSCVVACI